MRLALGTIALCIAGLTLGALWAAHDLLRSHP